MYTSHGHHIRGTVMNDPPLNVARCGGPRLCSVCALEVAEFEGREIEPIAIPGEMDELPYITVEQLSHDELVRVEAMGLAIKCAGGTVYATSWYILRAIEFEKYIKESPNKKVNDESS